RAGRRSGAGGRALRARGRPPLSGLGLCRRSPARSVLDRKRRQARRPVSDRRAAALPDPLPAAGGHCGLLAATARARRTARRVRGRRREVRRLAGHEGMGVRPRLAGSVPRRDGRAGREWRDPSHDAGDRPGRGAQRRTRLPADGVVPRDGGLGAAARCRAQTGATRARPGGGAARRSRRCAGAGGALAEFLRALSRVEPDAQEDAGAVGVVPARGRAGGGAQCNDAYWHGVFGGLYLPHLRHAIWHQLALAEGELRRGAPLAVERVDLDGDGFEEIWIHAAGFSAVVSPRRGGVIEEYARFGNGVNYAAVVTRRFEAYHALAREQAAHATAPVPDA